MNSDVQPSKLLLDRDDSRRIAVLVEAQPKNCWLNATLALVHLPDEAMYIEGWVIVLGVPIEHGWCESEGGIIDPTLTDDRVTAYFPGARYRLSEVISATVGRRRKLPLGGPGLRDLRRRCRAVYEAACVFARQARQTLEPSNE